MKTNVKVARELVKLAKSLAAAGYSKDAVRVKKEVDDLKASIEAQKIELDIILDKLPKNMAHVLEIGHRYSEDNMKKTWQTFTAAAAAIEKLKDAVHSLGEGRGV